MTPDVNVLVAASRTDHPHHEVARAWLEQSLGASATGAAYTLMPMVLASFLRLVTSPKIFQSPTPVEDAVAFLDALLGGEQVLSGHAALAAGCFEGGGDLVNRPEQDLKFERVHCSSAPLMRL